MLRIIQNTSAAGAKNYYTSASMAEYYTEGQELTGIWRGEGAARLGLSGAVQKEAWDALCDNRHPVTGEALTPRRKQERRVGYDFNFHVPKSVSLLYGLTQDERILDAFRASVDETMQDMESEVKTRVRKGGKNEDRIAGNMIWGEFIHTTARPVNGIPDPHLHAHCFVFNAIFDNAEGRWKAAQFGDLKRDGYFFEGVFHARMARRLAELNLPIERTRNGWEIAGVDKSTLKKFSRRTAHIEEKAKASGVTNAKEKDGLGAKTRERKIKNLSFDELRREWQSRLTDDERSGLLRTAEGVGGPPIPENVRGAKEAAVLATEHCFERKSVVAERELLAQALRRSVGLASVQVTEQAIRDQNLVTAERDGRRLVTTREVLNEEQRMTEFARRGRGTCPRLGDGVHEFQEQKLNDGQRRAVLHVLDSLDRVIIVRGSAGVGKTTALREAVFAIEANGKQVFTFAPSADASRGVLRAEGFKNADTVARLLVDAKLQEQIKGHVILIDEAGLLGTRAMSQVFNLAEKQKSRVILVGDPLQNVPVERGTALRLLETEAGLIPATIKTIQRQSGAYKQAVQAISEGWIQDGFKELDELGWVREVPEAERYKALAADYVEAIKAGKSSLAVSPTHRESDQIAQAIRSELRQSGRLGRDDRKITILRNSHMTFAQRQEAVNYTPGDVIVFTQNARRYAKGQRIIVGEGPLPLDQASRFQVFQRSTMDVSPGELIRVTQNGKTADRGKHRLNNGSTYSIRGFTKAGDIRLTNGWTVKKDFGHLSQGYCVTSYAAQSRTVDRVFIGQSSMSEPAASREAFYVAISRGRERVVIYTDQKEALRMAIEKTDDRLSATELVSSRERRERGVSLQRMERQAEVAKHPIQEREELIYGR